MAKVKTTVAEIERAIKLGSEITKYPLSKKEFKAFVEWDRKITEEMNQVVLDWDYQGKLNKEVEKNKKKYAELDKQVKMMNEKKIPKKVKDEIMAKVRERDAKNQEIIEKIRQEFNAHEAEVSVCVIDYPDHQPSGIVMVMESSPLFNVK